jgi:flagellin-like hook-associated protein FlgL
MTATATAPLTTIETLDAKRCHELDKAAERELLAAFVSLVPRNTYLADYLQGAVEDFEGLMRVDICVPRADRTRQMLADAREAAEQLKQRQAELRAVESKIAGANATLARCKADVQKAVDDARDAVATMQRLLGR